MVRKVALRLQAVGYRVEEASWSELQGHMAQEDSVSVMNPVAQGLE